MTISTEQKRQQDGEQGQHPRNFERAEQISVAPGGYVKGNHPHQHDKATQNEPVEEWQFARTDEANAQIRPGLNGIDGGLNPADRGNFAHVRVNLLFTLAMLIALFMSTGRTGLFLYLQLYAVGSFIVFFCLVVLVFLTALVNIYHKLRRRAFMPFFRCHNDIVFTAVAAHPFLNTGRFIFLVCAVAFFAATTNRLHFFTQVEILVPDTATGGGLNAAMGIMFAASAICAVMADAASLFVAFSPRKESTQ